ncbi:MAG: hypothetical protein O3A10_14675 [Chloroflexi bacterium]|nr:hypothetical protein [Chloroflexota bacterium]MDA1147685.1 hypothetical protein [Chloroflexota bacterium]
MTSLAPDAVLETAEAPTSRRHVRVPREGPLDPEQAVEALRRQVERDMPWYPALLEVIARWSAPEEELHGVRQRYLIGGEAFDWLLLAQRLLIEVEEFLPEGEVERLLIFGLPPDGSSEEDFARAIGGPKHRAHLNFQYGVTIEELLLLAAELELQKVGRLAGTGQPQPDVLAYERVYGKKLEELQLLYATETDTRLAARMRQTELQAFTYWCSKYRLRTSEPARVASDTKKALALMSRMDAGRGRLADREREPIDVTVPKEAPKAKRKRKPRKKKAPASES